MSHDFVISKNMLVEMLVSCYGVDWVQNIRSVCLNVFVLRTFISWIPLLVQIKVNFLKHGSTAVSIISFFCMLHRFPFFSCCHIYINSCQSFGTDLNFCCSHHAAKVIWGIGKINSSADVGCAFAFGFANRNAVSFRIDA